MEIEPETSYSAEGSGQREPWWKRHPPPPPPDVTLYTLSRQIRDLAQQVALLVANQKLDRQTEKEHWRTLMAQIDDLIADLSGLSDDLKAHTDDLAQLKTDFDAAVAALQAANIPPNLQPLIDKVLALRTGVNDADASAKALDATAKGLIPPTPIPTPTPPQAQRKP
jgi:hypothetical protein